MRRYRWVGWYLLAGLIVFGIMPGISWGVTWLVEEGLGIGRFELPVPNALAALPILLFGLYWMAWSSFTLRRFGKGQAIHAFGKAPAPTKRLCTGGCFQYCQNPMYFGWLTVMVAVGVWMGSWVFMILLPVLWVVFIYWYLPRFEWPALRERFGDEWVEWHRATPVILPRLWRRSTAGGRPLEDSAGTGGTGRVQ